MILEGERREYDPRAAYDRARAKNDPYLSPHGFFRKLAPGNNAHAKEFVEKFGPLGVGELLPHPHGMADKLLLARFWERHTEFCQAAALWESGDENQLRSAWEKISASYPIESPTGGFELRRLHGQDKKSFDQWLGQANLKTLRREAINFLRLALDAQSGIAGSVKWEWDSPRGHFQPIITGSLWGRLWQFFAWDIAGNPWRWCAYCGRLFYPRQEKSLCCNTREQSLLSKREYARRMRAEARRKRGRRK